MMWNANLDIAGLYAIDNTIFDNFVFPTTTVVDTEGKSHNLAFTDEEKTNIIDMILFQSENRCVRYENPDVFKNRLEIFSKKMSNDDWEKIMYYSFFTRTFNPTENVFEITTEDTTRANGRTLTYNYTNYKETSAQTADGKNNTSFANYKETDEQVVDGKNNTTFSNYKETNAQTADGKSNQTFSNYVETDNQTVAGTKESHGADVKGKGSMSTGQATVAVTQGSSDGYGTASGTLPIAEADTTNQKDTENMGTIEHSKTGAINNALSDGTHELSKEGAINIAVGDGKKEHSRSGAINIATSEGTIEKSITGSKSEVETFAPNPDHFVRNRHGNIGVTMSGEIILNTFNTEKELDVETRVIEDVIDELTLAVF